MNKKNIFLLIIAATYICTLGFLVPYIIIIFNLPLYDFIEDLSAMGVLFFLCLISTFVFVPFIYSTLVKERLSFNINKANKNGKSPRYYARILFLIGIPVMIWLIIGNLRFYSTTVFVGGMALFVHNGFLVLVILIMYFCIIPAIVLGLKKNM
jgi:hypothetical protein